MIHCYERKVIEGVIYTGKIALGKKSERATDQILWLKMNLMSRRREEEQSREKMC